jgi:hypothetical protein
MNTAVAAQTANAGDRINPWVAAWAVGLALSVAVYLFREHWLWAWRYPREWNIPLRFYGTFPCGSG